MRHSRLQWFIAILAALCLLASAQARAQTVEPREFGINLPPGLLTPGQDRAVTTDDQRGEPTVGKILVRIGEGAIVFLPSGQLAGRAASRFAPTERRFEPLTKEQVQAQLTEEFPRFKTKSTNHYLYAYNSSEECFLGTSRILETMLPGVKAYVDSNKIRTRDPEFPLVAVMFKTESEFQRYRRMPEGVVAYYDVLTNRVYMFEQSRLAEVRPDLAVQQAVSTVAHEGVHQILHNIGVQQRLSIWPMWLSEGLAEFFAPTSTGARLHWKGAGQVNDMRMFELEQYLKSSATKEPSGELVEHTVLANQLTSTGYASAWALTHFLAKTRRAEFNELLSEAHRLGPFAGATQATAQGTVLSNREQFARLIGDDFKDLERRLVLHLKKQPYSDPFKNAPHFVATLTFVEGRKTQRSANTFHSPQLAAKWLRESREKIPDRERESAQTSLRGFPTRLQAEAFAQQWLANK